MIAPTRRSRKITAVILGGGMQALLRLSRAIDALNGAVGRLAYWLILVAVLISAANAMIRYIFSTSSNAWLEVQWYLFSAVFLLCSGYTLLRNEHVRIDIVIGRFSPRTQSWIELLGGILFLMPMALIILYLSWDPFLESLARNEYSANAGGLIRWPARLMIPAGFLLLALQGVSEVIKRAAFLGGLIPDPTVHRHAPEIEEGHGVGD
jgi:TRAP-type mannitol/chloroaromatic compound transport system permease small subunit